MPSRSDELLNVKPPNPTTDAFGPCARAAAGMHRHSARRIITLRMIEDTPTLATDQKATVVPVGSPGKSTNSRTSADERGSDEWDDGAARMTIRIHILLAPLLLMLLYVLVVNAWVVDDAYITFRTIDNFLNGYGLRWNVAERVQSHILSGCS
jgi:hypothetical protein